MLVENNCRKLEWSSMDKYSHTGWFLIMPLSASLRPTRIEAGILPMQSIRLFVCLPSVGRV